MKQFPKLNVERKVSDNKVDSLTYDIQSAIQLHCDLSNVEIIAALNKVTRHYIDIEISNAIGHLVQ